MDICLERADLLAFSLCCFTLYHLDFFVPFPYGVWGRKWNSIVSVPDHCHFIYFGTLVNNGWMCCEHQNQNGAAVRLKLYFFIFLSLQFSNIKFLSPFSLKL